jgi:hypothetical protein
VPPPSIVEDLEVFKDRVCELDSSLRSLTIEKFDLPRQVPAITW